MKSEHSDAYPRQGSHSSGTSKELPPRMSRSSDPDHADELLEALGYTSQLARSRSTWGVAFMSFVLASVPYGLSTTLYYPLTGGGPTTVIWGWVAVCALMMCVAISLGEITSVCCNVLVESNAVIVAGVILENWTERNCRSTQQLAVSTTRLSCFLPGNTVL